MREPSQGNQRRRKPNFSRTRERRDVPDSPHLEQVQKDELHEDIERLHGPETVHYGTDELVVLTVMRDGRPYVRSFVEHYRALGAKHMVFLDNGSEDGTVEALSRYEDVTVLRTRLLFREYGICMRQYLVERFGKGRWTLTVDIDELFVYPYQDVVSLDALLRYLNDNSYTAVVANMLDMFPEKPLSDTGEAEEDEPLKERHRFYDISNIRTQDYELVGDIGNELSNEDVRIFRDGIRQTLFNIPTLLIKHPLVFLDDEVRPIDLSEHWVGNARIADFTGALLHYKLMDRLFGMVRHEVRARNYPNRWGKYDNYLAALEAGSSLRIKTDTARELQSVDGLVANRFMVVSREYMRLVERRSRSLGESPERHMERLVDTLLGALAEVREWSRKFEDVMQELGVEELRNQVRHAQGKNRELRERLDERESRIEQLSAELRKLQEEARNSRSLKQELEGIRGSKAWRLLDLLNRAKIRFLNRK